MVYVNKQGYLERKTHSGRRNPHGKSTTRNWWMIKSGTINANVMLGNDTLISFPLKYIGRKVRFKVEFVEEKNENIKK